MNIKTIILIFIVAMAVVGGGAFYGGMKYVESNSPAGGLRGFRNGKIEGGFSGITAGEIISRDDKSITVKLKDGGSRIIFFSDAMEITKLARGSLNDLAVGAEIRVNGSQNSDGSVTAQSIQLSPQIR